MMTHQDFEVAARDVVENYWRIRAALAFFRTAPFDRQGVLRYSGVPEFGRMVGLLSEETKDRALDSLEQYASQRLAGDLFLALIARFESRLVSRLQVAGLPTGGTLGKLQVRVQQNLSIPRDYIDGLDEIRERRNALMHNGGIAQAQYVSAAQRLDGRTGLWGPIPVLGASVLPSAPYLSYAANALIEYSSTL